MTSRIDSNCDRGSPSTFPIRRCSTAPVLAWQRTEADGLRHSTYEMTFARCVPAGGKHIPMQKAAATVTEDDFFVLSSLPPSPVQKQLALVFVLGLLAVFVLITAGPLSGVHLSRVDAFVPAYATALFVNDTITAILLYAQFSILRSRASLVIASGYLFSALILIPWILVFPGVFAPKGLVGGVQSTSWLYFFQHAGFPLFVIGYALALSRCRADRRVLRIVA